MLRDDPVDCSHRCLQNPRRQPAEPSPTEAVIPPSKVAPEHSRFKRLVLALTLLLPPKFFYGMRHHCTKMKLRRLEDSQANPSVRHSETLRRTKQMPVSFGADIVARFLNSIGYFRGKVRAADLLGRLSGFCSGGRGIFPVDAGTNVSVDLRDRVQRLMWGGAYEPHVRECLKTILRPGDTFVDVGAHIGFFSMIASSLVGVNGNVYAFEANSNLFGALQANASAYSWLVPSLRAVWSESGRVAFSDPMEPGESGWGKLASIRNEGHEVFVEAVSLDDWHASVGFPPIRAIKIDAEGSEPFILEGARRMIACTRPILIIELNGELLREVGKSKEAVIANLQEQRYLIGRLGVEKNKKQGNVSDALSPEVLCLPSERADEAAKTLRNLHLEVVSSPFC